VATDPQSRQGTRAQHPIFGVDVALGSGAVLRRGQRAMVRFTLPPEPLAVQGFRKLRRVIQERFRGL